MKIKENNKNYQKNRLNIYIKKKNIETIVKIQANN